jgi:hypothetical protein
MLQPADPGHALVLLACGTPPQVTALQAAVGPAVAEALQRHLVAALPVEPGPQAHAALAELPPNALVPLPQDPGRTAADGSHWAELLGAWRQPCLLLISADQLDSGVAAATTALLQQWQVPLLGLVQWQGSWDRGARLADRLPWLGVLGGPEADADALALAAARRMQQLQAQLR